jgi:hypothetical protein
MLGTFGGALEARQIDASGGRLTADVTGEAETVDRVHGVYAMRRPLYRTLHQAIALSSSIELPS